jgi:hypothetical protein
MIVHTIGDSHASAQFSHWGKHNIPGVEIRAHHIGGRLMYTFGRGRRAVLDIRRFGVQNGHAVIFCFGEIDCRNHVHKHITPDRDYDSIVDDLAIHYMAAIEENVDQFEDLEVYVYNVVPPRRYMDVGASHPFPYLGDDGERKMYTLELNRRLKKLCEKYAYTYFDLYDAACDEEGFLNSDMSDGCGHLIDPAPADPILRELAAKS